MTIRRTLGTCGAASAAVVLTVALGASPGSAHPAPFTVTAGSAPVGTDVAVTKTTVGTSPQVFVTNTTTGTKLACTSASLGGSVRTGSTNGSPLVTLNGPSLMVNNCTGPFNLAFKVTGYGTWAINVNDVTNGVATGTVTGLRLHVQSTSGPTCSFDIGANSGSFSSSGTSTIAPGTLPGKYTNSTQQIAIPATNPGSLGAWNVNPTASAHNCVAGSVFAQGDKLSVAVTFKITANVAAYNPIAIN